MRNPQPFIQWVIILDLHNLTLPLSLTRVRGELWHLPVFVNRSRWKHRRRKAGLAWTLIDPTVSRLAVQIDDRHRRRKRLSCFPGSTTKERFVRRSCVSIHLVLSVQPGEDGRVIHLASTVDGHYLWVVCLSAGVFCRDSIMALT